MNESAATIAYVFGLVGLGWLTARLGDAAELPETLIFDFPTLRQIEEHVDGVMQPRSAAPTSVVAAPAVDLNAALLAQLLGGQHSLAGAARQGPKMVHNGPILTKNGPGGAENAPRRPPANRSSTRWTTEVLGLMLRAALCRTLTGNNVLLLNTANVNNTRIFNKQRVNVKP